MYDSSVHKLIVVSHPKPRPRPLTLAVLVWLLALAPLVVPVVPLPRLAADPRVELDVPLTLLVRDTPRPEVGVAAAIARWRSSSSARR